MQLAEAARSYLHWLQVERGASHNTLEAYREDLENLRGFLEKSGHSDELQKWSLEPLRQFVVHQDVHYATATLVRRLACLRGLCRFAVREGWLSQDWSEHLESPKLWQRLPDVLSAGEIQKLLQAAEGSRTPLRERCIVEMLYGAGLRVSELVGLRLADLNREQRLLKVSGKGGVERMVPIGDFAFEALKEYVERERPRLAAHQARPPRGVLLGVRGGALSRQHVSLILAELGRAAGLEKSVHPHMLRHTYATHMLENGADIRVIQELLGHADVSTTQRYTHLDKKDLRRNYLHWHPRGG